MKKVRCFIPFIIFAFTLSCLTDGAGDISGPLQVCNPSQTVKTLDDGPVALYDDSWYAGVNIYDWAAGINTMDYTDYDYFLSEGKWTSLSYENCREIGGALDLKTDDDDYTKLSRILHLRDDLMTWENRHMPNVTADFIWETKNVEGCADVALFTSTVLRKYGLPTIMVNSVYVPEDGNVSSMSGHFFLEVYADKKWILVDPSTLEIFNEYDPLDGRIFTHGDRSYFIVRKGLNVADHSCPDYDGLDEERRQFESAAALVGEKAPKPPYPAMKKRMDLF